MEVLGGGATHHAAGMRIWGERAGVIASIGDGIPPAVLTRLEGDFDLSVTRRLPLPQARAWQIFEWDGKRTEIFRVEQMMPFIDTLPPAVAPPEYRALRALTLVQDDISLLGWRKLLPDAVLLWEPNQPFMVAENRDRLREAIPHADILSPNLLEARQVYGDDDPIKLVRMMLADGAPLVALRMGEAGSLIGTQENDTLLKIPAVPVREIVDQTGAGNTYCGGFLVGWLRTHDLCTAAAYGAVAASFALEVMGVATASAEHDSHERDSRYAALQARIATLT